MWRYTAVRSESGSKTVFDFEDRIREIGEKEPPAKRDVVIHWEVFREPIEQAILPVRPWHRNVARAVKKETKYYFYDTGQVVDGPGTRLENAVACSLLKKVQFDEDSDGRRRSLHYVRTRDGKEIDFAVVQEGTLTHLIEVKERGDSLSPTFALVRAAFPDAVRVQLSRTVRREKTLPTGEELRAVAPFLATVDLRPIRWIAPIDTR